MPCIHARGAFACPAMYPRGVPRLGGVNGHGDGGGVHLQDGHGWRLRFNAWAGFADRCGGPISDIGVRGSGGCPEVGPCHHLACGDRKMVQFIFKFRVSHQKPVFCPKTPNGRCGGVAVPRGQGEEDRAG